MQYFQLHGDQYLICLNKKYSWKFFKKRVKVAPGSYSENFAKGLYSSVFESAYDISQEYRKYYQDEYDNIYHFMFWRYGVSEEICKQIPNAENEYLAVFEVMWRIEDADLLKDTFTAIFKELDK